MVGLKKKTALCNPTEDIPQPEFGNHWQGSFSEIQLPLEHFCAAVRNVPDVPQQAAEESWTLVGKACGIYGPQTLTDCFN